MKNSMRMLAKELKEILRTYKIYVVPGIFLLFGFASPILTKLMPKLLANLADEINLILPEMTWMDSYAQFFKNLVQIGILAIILTTMGTIADERKRGVTQLILTKPVSRTGYVVAKYSANLLLISAATLAAFFATWLYTDILFDGTQFAVGLGATGLYLVYAAVILALTIAASAVTKSTVAAGGLSILGYFILSLLPLFGKGLSKYSPAVLVNHISQVIAGTADTANLCWTVVVAAATILGLLTLGSTLFNRQEL